uniref:Angiopoietin 4 n=1 Tax=Paramormyrops kingsleyae TaxID=1676925 RepID=A0A3B3SIY9_9TELE
MLDGVQLRFRDCAEIYKAGYNTSGVYHIYADSNATEPTKVFCDMQTSGGGWTVFQRRVNGSVDFQRTWKEYKMVGFGDVAGEHWLGNEVVFRMTATSQPQYSLRVELQDWEGNSPYSLYDKFQLGDEKQHYRLFLRGYSGTAGMQSSLAAHGTSFSTRDSDHDNCLCKCALMLTGGWWFDACGLSNLNGMYYTVGHNIRKLNGIKWHHFRGPSYSLRSTTMMIRPSDF